MVSDGFLKCRHPNSLRIGTAGVTPPTQSKYLSLQTPQASTERTIIINSIDRRRYESSRSVLLNAGTWCDALVLAVAVNFLACALTDASVQLITSHISRRSPCNNAPPTDLSCDTSACCFEHGMCLSYNSWSTSNAALGLQHLFVRVTLHCVKVNSVHADSFLMPIGVCSTVSSRPGSPGMKTISALAQTVLSQLSAGMVQRSGKPVSG